jgi:hypothetical protein
MAFPERFHQCASYEGVHLIVWSGEPLKGRERWHRYYSLPYATDPTCWQDSTETSQDED